MQNPARLFSEFYSTGNKIKNTHLFKLLRNWSSSVWAIADLSKFFWAVANLLPLSTHVKSAAAQLRWSGPAGGGAAARACGECETRYYLIFTIHVHMYMYYMHTL